MPVESIDTLSPMTVRNGADSRNPVIEWIAPREGKPFDLAPGDSILLYTDGATEARSSDDENDLFGESRLRGVVARHGAEPPRAYLDAIVAALLAHTGQDEMGDDLTLVAVRRTP